LENLCKSRSHAKTVPKARIQKYVNDALKNLKHISVTRGSKNVYDIIDSLKSNH